MVLPAELEGPLQALLARRPDLVFDLHWLSTVGSTMDVAASMVADGAPGGTVVVAGSQSAGRGRRGHSWESPPGAGLYLSLVWRPRSAGAGGLSLVTLAAGLGVREGIASATGLSTDIKWPNDLLVGGRKLAGILAEGIGLGGGAPAVVIGVGVNVLDAALSPEVGPRATSLEAELGRAVDRGAVLAALLAALHDELSRLEHDADGILQAWRAAAPSAVGSPVQWDAPSGRRRGVTAGVDASGALLVRTADGVERITAGEVSWNA